MATGKIGVFDSGLGGLIITHSLIAALPVYDYLYLGDAEHMPYGNRSSEQVYEFTRAAIDWLFEQGCELIVVACNTASAEALRRLQQEYLPARYPDRRILGVLIPAVEATLEATQGTIGLIATTGTVHAGTFERELRQRDEELKITSVATPLLVPLIEYDGGSWVEDVARSYLEPLLEQGIDTLILGCTHYPAIKATIRTIVGDTVTVVSQDEVVPPKLADYLQRHPELEERLAKRATRAFYVTDQTSGSAAMAAHLYGDSVQLKTITYPLEA